MDMYLLEQFPWSVAEADELLRWASLEQCPLTLDGVVSLTDRLVLPLPPAISPTPPFDPKASARSTGPPPATTTPAPPSTTGGSAAAAAPARGSAVPPSSSSPGGPVVAADLGEELPMRSGHQQPPQASMAAGGHRASIRGAGAGPSSSSNKGPGVPPRLSLSGATSRRKSSVVGISSDPHTVIPVASHAPGLCLSPRKKERPAPLGPLPPTTTAFLPPPPAPTRTGPAAAGDQQQPEGGESGGAASSLTAEEMAFQVGGREGGRHRVPCQQ